MYVVAKDERRKKTDCRRATATESTTMWCRRSSAPICDAAVAVAGAVDIVVVLLGSLARLALTVASSVGRLVCRMNECSWCQPRPITRYTTLTQCLLLLLLLLQWRRRHGARASLPLAAAGKRRRGAAVNDTALSFLYVPFYSGLGWSSDRKSSSLLRLDY